MNKPKSIQLDFDLFLMIIDYLDMHPDWNDPVYVSIIQSVQNKLDAMLRRALFTLYKTSSSAELRSYARKMYLDEIGIPESFRWDDQGKKNEF